MALSTLGRLLPPTRDRIDGIEYLDHPGQPPSLLAGNLDDLRRINRWLGGHWLTLRGIEDLLEGYPRDAGVSVVDVGTGGGDVPEATVRWAGRTGRRVHVLAGDVSPEILGLARRQVTPLVDLAVLDGRCLPLADGSVDVAVCSLLLHHLSPDDAIALFREMRRVARRGVVVNDLVRSRLGYLGALAIARFATRNPLTRHDGPLSVRRAYTRTEMADLAARAGLGPVTFRGWLGYRVAMVSRTPR
jgi:ubiquinone/menaquinone biosynthesis C-methylase UbiE